MISLGQSTLTSNHDISSHLRKCKARLGVFTVLVFMTTVGIQPCAWALNQIIKPYQSVRSAGMGGVRMTTGLYDENFFGNPARATANPRSRFTLLQLTPFEYTLDTLAAQGSIISGTDPLGVAADNAGKNLHDRFQLILPAYYHAAVRGRKMAVAIGMIVSAQVDANLRQSYQTDLSGIADIGPAITIARQFLRDDRLSVGITTHLIYRVSFRPNYGLVDYVSGNPLSISSLGGEGAMLDFDIGGTYDIAKIGAFHLNAALAMQNILGGGYSNLGLKPFNLSTAPQTQPRSLGLGGSLTRDHWGVFKDTTLALEATDIFNNANGSFFRLLHLGVETNWKSIAIRLGMNQGYWTAGLGLDLRFVTLNLSSYGEEMGLNAGTQEDRRYTADLGFHF